MVVFKACSRGADEHVLSGIHNDYMRDNGVHIETHLLSLSWHGLICKEVMMTKIFIIVLFLQG